MKQPMPYPEVYLIEATFEDGRKAWYNKGRRFFVDKKEDASEYGTRHFCQGIIDNMDKFNRATFAVLPISKT